MDLSRRASDDVLPFDVLVNVLTRVPVKSLGRFRCVSKPWRSLIESSYFKKMRLDRRRTCFLVVPLFPRARDICSLICDSAHVWQKKLEPPLDEKDYEFLSAVGSCSGLICLKGTSIVTDDGHHREEFVCMWNPFSGEFRTLDHKRFVGQRFVYGFGMDATTGENKVVRITYSWGPTGAEVYTLSRNTWRSLGHELINFTCFTQGNSKAFVNGAVHWLAEPAEGAGHTSMSILSFDIAKEVFREIRLPDEMVVLTPAWSRFLNLTLTVFQHRLAVFVFGPNCDRLTVWVMKEYGVAESWSRLHDSILTHPSVRIQACLRFTVDGQILLRLSNGKLVSCDVDNMQFTEVATHTCPLYDVIEVCREPGLQLEM